MFLCRSNRDEIGEEEEPARAAREAAAREEAEIRGAERIEREGAPPGAG